MLIVYTVIVCVALLMSGILGTLFVLDQRDMIKLREVTFFWVASLFHFGMLMAVIFIGNLCAYIANMN